MNTENEKKKTKSTIGGLVFVGCLMLGIGIGFIKHAVHIGAVIGLALALLPWLPYGLITTGSKANPYIFVKKRCSYPLSNKRLVK